MYISNTNHLFSIKVQFGQAALHITSVSPLLFTYTQTVISCEFFYHVTHQSSNNHLCATENISALGLNE